MQDEQPATEPTKPELVEPGEPGLPPEGEARVKFEESAASAAALKAKTDEIKELVAHKVRADSEDRYALTAREVLIELDDDLRYGRIDLAALLAEMPEEERYQDVSVVTTATGMVFVYSFRFIASDVALAKAMVEEAKCMLARTIREDSLERAKLTPAVKIHAMAPNTDPSAINELIEKMRAEERFADLKTVTDAAGAVYYHSDKYLVESYAATLLMAMAGDHCATIAETVRDESRTYPRTTNLAVFHDQALYGVPAEELDAIVLETLRRAEYCDLKKLVHPVTGAVHLYSDRYLKDDAAWALMDWDEVGRANNP